jgi:hypothetical protein
LINAAVGCTETLGERIVKLLRALWDGLGDDRLGLLLAGGTLVIAITELKSGDYTAAVIDLAFAATIGYFAWRDIGRAVRS